MENLAVWLAKNKMTRVTLAKKIGIRSNYLYNIDAGYFIPSQKVAAKIYRVTNGQVCIKFNRHTSSVETMNEKFAEEIERKIADKEEE